VFVFQGAAADEIAHDDPSLAFVVVFEADNNHAVASDTTAPAIVTVFSADFACGDEFEVAVCADVVVALIAFETMESRG
jgi:hypothetical protein